MVRYDSDMLEAVLKRFDEEVAAYDRILRSNYYRHRLGIFIYTTGSLTALKLNLIISQVS